MSAKGAFALATFTLLGFGSHAPIQCSHDPDPSERIEDTAGDALWDLAADFEARGNHDASRRTLEMLATRYPSSRHATAAKDILDGGAWTLPLEAGPGVGMKATRATEP